MSVCPPTYRYIAPRMIQRIILKFCGYVGCDDATNVSNFGYEPIKFSSFMLNIRMHTKIWYIRGIVTPNIPTKLQDNPLNHSWRNIAICRRTDWHTHIQQLMSQSWCPQQGTFQYKLLFCRAHCAAAPSFTGASSTLVTGVHQRRRCPSERRCRRRVLNNNVLVVILPPVCATCD